MNWAVKKNGETTVETLSSRRRRPWSSITTASSPTCATGPSASSGWRRTRTTRAEVYDCASAWTSAARTAAREEYVDYETFYTYATVFSERTNAWLAEHGIEPSTLEQLGNEYLYT